MGGGRLRRPPLINSQFYIKNHKNMYKTYTKYIKIYESTTPQPHIIRLLAVPGQYPLGNPENKGVFLHISMYSHIYK